MKDLFDRTTPKMTPDEDRRVWSALSGALDTKHRPWWQRRGVLGTATVAATAVVALAVWTPRMDRGPIGTLAEVNEQSTVPVEEMNRRVAETPAGTEGALDRTAVTESEAAGEAKGKDDRAALQSLPYLSSSPELRDDLRGDASGEKNEPAPTGVRQETVTNAAGRDEDGGARHPANVGEVETDATLFAEPAPVAAQPVNGEPGKEQAQKSAPDRNRVPEAVSLDSDTGRNVRGLAPATPEGVARPVPEAAPIPETSFRAPQPPISVGGTDPVNGEPYDAMFFRDYGVNPFVDPAEDRFATFAVDVDDASYALARSYLQRGNLPPQAAVRVEEFVNAFDHHYPAPTGDLLVDRESIPTEHGTFAIHLAGGPSPFAADRMLFRVGLKGRTVDPEMRKPAMLTFVVDVSGSMDREDRLGLVKQSLGLLLGQLRSDDWIALVVYGSNARTILTPTPVSDRRRIEQAIASLRPEGATNAEAGLVEAYRLADRHLTEGWINRVILCSDGVANVGNTGPDSILERIKREARRGITLTTVGFGMGNYNDVLMERLANDGDGNYHYVDSIREAEKIFVDDLTANLQIIARETKIQVEFDRDAVRRYRLIGYENRDVADVDFRNDQVDAGEVGAGHEVTALFEVVLTKDARPDDEFAVTRIRYEDPATGRVTEEARAFRVKEVARSWKDAEPTLRLDAATASFAELLRGSYWARNIDLATPRQLADRAYRDLGRPEEVAELLGLIDTADRLWPSQAPTPWKDDPRFGEDEPR